MGFDRAGDGPGWVTVRVPTSTLGTLTAQVHRDTLTGRTPAMAGRQRSSSGGNSGSDEQQNLAAAAPDEDAAKETERRAEAADKADVTPHAQWRQERIDNAGEQNSPEAVAAEYGHVTYAPDDDNKS